MNVLIVVILVWNILMNIMGNVMKIVNKEFFIMKMVFKLINANVN